MLRKYEIKIPISFNVKSAQESLEMAKALAKQISGGRKGFIKVLPMARTDQQNKALHVLYKQWSDGLNERGLDIFTVLSNGLKIPWTDKLFKELYWRPLQEKLTGKKSTTKLNKTQEIDLIYDTINREFSERYGLHIPFPCFEELLNQHFNTND